MKEKLSNPHKLFTLYKQNYKNEYTLNDLIPGDYAFIKCINTTGSMRRRLLDIGLIENTIVECLGKSPGGDPTAFLIRGAVIAIRSEDCANIVIKSEEEVA